MVNIYLRDLNINSSSNSSLSNFKNKDDYHETAVYYLPTIYLQNHFTITPNDNIQADLNKQEEINKQEFIIINPSCVKTYNTLFDEKLHLNTALSTVLQPKLYDKNDIDYPTTCNVEQDVLRFLDIKMISNIKGAYLYIDVKQALNHIYSNLEEGWINQYNNIINKDTSKKDGKYYSENDNTCICGEIYSQMVQQDNLRALFNKKNINSNGSFNIPFKDGDIISYLISIKLPYSLETRNYLVQLISTSDRELFINNNNIHTQIIGDTKQYGIYFQGIENFIYPFVIQTIVPNISPTNFSKDMPINVPNISPINVPSNVPTNVPNISPTNVPTNALKDITTISQKNAGIGGTTRGMPLSYFFITTEH